MAAKQSRKKVNREREKKLATAIATRTVARRLAGSGVPLRGATKLG